MAGNLRNYTRRENTIHDEKPRTTSGHGPCEVYDCPMPGHIHTGNWNCRYHWNKHGDKLTHITHALNAHLPDFRWMDSLRTASIVDFDMRKVHKRAPYGLEPKDGEPFTGYKSRISAHVAELLKSNPVHIPEHHLQPGFP